MKISEIMTENSVMIDIKADTKRQLLQELSEQAGKLTGVDSRSVFDAVLERENLGSTGFGGGTALPHGRIAGLDKVHAIFAKLSSPVNFDSIDGKPVDMIFTLLSPEDCGADHLTALAQISRILKNESLCDKLRKMHKTDEIFALLNNEN